MKKLLSLLATACLISLNCNYIILTSKIPLKSNNVNNLDQTPLLNSINYNPSYSNISNNQRIANQVMKTKDGVGDTGDDVYSSIIRINTLEYASSLANFKKYYSIFSFNIKHNSWVSAEKITDPHFDEVTWIQDFLSIQLVLVLLEHNEHLRVIKSELIIEEE